MFENFRANINLMLKFKSMWCVCFCSDIDVTATSGQFSTENVCNYVLLVPRCNGLQ